jgi:uncharacterized protein
MSLFWIIFSYLLGSVPFGYLISRFSGKNILAIGWRKTSGSNVFRNVGKWQGILTGLLDVAKGYLAVRGAAEIGLSPEIQVFSGAAAVIGHNWSLFLRFSGGRGIGTFIGALLAVSPQILFFSIIPLIVLALFWDAAVGTLFFLAGAVLISLYFNQFETAGLFTVICLVPILIKRLSPLEEIKKMENKAALIANRLFFDNETANWRLRIKRIVRSLLFPPKLGWQAAKFGAKMAKKPIEKWVFRNHEKIVTEITIDDFKKMMIAAAKKIVAHQEEINRINVFPVADKDTGYNLAATLLGVEGTIYPKSYSTFRELTQDIKTAAMINARGNAGMIYTGYVVEVLDRIKHLETIDAFHLALAMKKGIKAARLAILEPVEGTILDVIKTAGQKSFELAKIRKEKNIVKVLAEAHKTSQIALKETKEKLQVLKENDVVDAGALGFVKILEAWIESLKGAPLSSENNFSSSSFAALRQVKEELKYAKEVVLMFEKTPETDIGNFKKELSLLGDSLEILEVEGRIKLHIHTDRPEAVLDKFRNFPGFESRTENLEVPVEKKGKRALGLVVDEVADLPEDFLRKNDILEVPFTTRFPDGEIIFSKEGIYEKMKQALKAGKPLPTTSAPSFKEFFSVFEKAFEKFEKILVITISSKLSGAYSSARIARSIYKKPEKLDIYVFDCNTAEAAEGLAAVKANELISQGKTTEEIVEILRDFCPKITLVACLSDFRYVVRGGRLKLPKVFVGPVSSIQKIGIRFLVGLKNGKLRFFGAALAKDAAGILAKEIDKQRKGRKIRVAIAYAGSREEAEKLESFLRGKTDVEVLFVSPVSPVVATHTGPGALLAAFHPVDE